VGARDWRARQVLERQERERRRAGGASVQAMAYGSGRCGQVLSGTRAEGAGGAISARV
jgi:hypothetical protein